MKNNRVGFVDMVTEVVTTICDYAVDNGESPDEVMKETIALLHAASEISTYENWKSGNN